MGDSRISLPGWIASLAAAESLGMAAASAAARLGEYSASALFTLAVSIVAGAVEGAALGAVQGRLLATLSPRVNRRRFLWVTTVSAAVGWALGMLPASMNSDSGSIGPEPPLWLILIAAAAMGMSMGALLGLAQSAALKGAFENRMPWFWGQLVAWTLAMPVIFLGATSVPAGIALGWLLLAGASTGGAAGVVLGLASWPFVFRLRPGGRFVSSVGTGSGSCLCFPFLDRLAKASIALCWGQRRIVR